MFSSLLKDPIVVRFGCEALRLTAPKLAAKELE
jgi:hypothetical protein